MISNHYTSPWTLSRLSDNINDTFHWSANAWTPFCFWMVTKCWKLVLKCGLTCILSKTRTFNRIWNSFPLFYILFNAYNSVIIYSFNLQHQCVNQPSRDLFQRFISPFSNSDLKLSKTLLQLLWQTHHLLEQFWFSLHLSLLRITFCCHNDCMTLRPSVKW